VVGSELLSSDSAWRSRVLRVGCYARSVIDEVSRENVLDLCYVTFYTRTVHLSDTSSKNRTVQNY
jgi:hypothetical protein